MRSSIFDFKSSLRQLKESSALGVIESLNLQGNKKIVFVFCFLLTKTVYLVYVCSNMSY